MVTKCRFITSVMLRRKKSKLCTKKNEKRRKLVLVKLSSSSSPSTVSTSLSVTIKENLEWILTVGDHHFEKGNSEVLEDTPSIIDSVFRMINLLKTLDACRICIGNPDAKFFELMDARRGIIKDVLGM